MYAVCPCCIAASTARLSASSSARRCAIVMWRAVSLPVDAVGPPSAAFMRSARARSCGGKTGTGEVWG